MDDGRARDTLLVSCGQTLFPGGFADHDKITEWTRKGHIVQSSTVTTLQRGAVRPLAAASTAALALGIGLVSAAPADAATTRTSYSRYVSDNESRAMRCGLEGGPGASGLQAWPSAVRNRVAAQFGMTDIGGYRPGSGKSDHHSGNALDVMVRGEQGDRIAWWFRKNADTLNVKYVIWEQGYWQPGMSGYRPMADRGSVTANHYDHVHVSFRNGSGSCPA